jgi:hypothetical protein
MDRSPFFRRFHLILVLAVSLAVGGVTPVEAAPPSPGARPAAASAVPRRATYDITISGTTYFGDTNFPGATTRYSAYQDFTLRGTLVILSTRDRSGVNFDNGRNARDVGIFVGRPFSSPQAGAVWFATNTTVFADVGIGNVSQRLASLDVAYVKVNDRRNTIAIQVDDQSIARTSQLNGFNVKSGLTANVYQILAGGMELRFDSSGRQVSGSLDFIGSGYLYPGSTRVQATLSGRRRGL